jgi:hypothetical protein
MAQFQQQGLAGALNTAGQFGNLRGSYAQGAYTGAQNRMGLASVFQNRMLGAAQSGSGLGLNAILGTSAGVIQGAGAQYMGDAIKARAQQAQQGQMFKLAGTAAGAYFGGPMGAKAGGTLADGISPAGGGGQERRK